MKLKHKPTKPTPKKFNVTTMTKGSLKKEEPTNIHRKIIERWVPSGILPM
jgi:hypothetical protein